MLLQLNVYQNGDMRIVKRDEVWEEGWADDDYKRDVYLENYFEQIKHNDIHRQVDLYKRYQDVVQSLNALRSMKGMEQLNKSELAGDVVITQACLSFTAANGITVSNKGEDGLIRADLEFELNRLTAKFIEEIQQLKKEIGWALDKVKF